MLKFRTADGAHFHYDVDFDAEPQPFANISFFGPQLRDIFFHLSLRRNEGIAVTNARHDDRWQAERPHPARFRPGRNMVSIGFLDDAVTVSLNNEEIAHFEGEYARLDEIVQVDWNGAILGDSIEMEGSANVDRHGEGMIALEAPLMLRGWAHDGARASQRLAVSVQGLADSLRVIALEAPELAARVGARSTKLAFSASLPGRVWRAADAEGAITLVATSNGIPCGDPLRLTRNDILAEIEALTARMKPEEDSFAALSVIEHTRFAGLFEQLSETARGHVLKAARLYNVMGFLFPDRATAAPPPSGPKNHTDLLIEAAERALAQALRQAPEAGMIPPLRSILPAWPLPRLVLRLAEPACQNGVMVQLHALASELGLADPPPPQDSWHQSLFLPFLLLRGDLAQLARGFETLAKNGGTWVCGATLGWTLTELAGRVTNPWDDIHIESILRSFMEITERLAGSYWRLPCGELIGAAATMLRRRGPLSDQMQAQMQDFVLRVFGLLPQFWERLRNESGTTALSAEVLAARKAFDVIAAQARGEAPDPVALNAALAFFGTLGAIEIDRVRRELLGPGGVAGPASAALLRAGNPDIRETALRVLAFPEPSRVALEADGRALLREASRIALHNRWNNVPKAPYYSTQLRGSRGILALLRQIEAEGATPAAAAALADLLPYLRKLSGQYSQHLGLGLNVLLIEGLIARHAETMAQQALAHLIQLVETMPEQMRAALHDKPALLSALALLRCRAAGHPVTLATLALFPGQPETTVPARANALPHLENATPLFDTIVTIFSCKPYLETRIPPLRAGWLKDLEALGIPYVIVVGDGDGRIEDDIVHLDAPDDYEGLPHKTLAAVDWVYRNTSCGHMLKIDDDCFLNVDEYFHSQSYRKFAYYGRALKRELGAMNRCWHHEKSRSDHARLELDKSPEPASYADGGGGYMLSRPAMRALLDAAASPEGMRLISTSFMEDKMVGDLLAMRKITVSAEDYFTTIWRRTHGAARPVMMWDNYFTPSAASPCKMMHLDTSSAQASVQDGLGADELRPRKLWPGFYRAGLGYNTNQLELLSDERKLERLNAAPVAVIAVSRNERARLPAFLAHYRRLGVSCFLFIDNLSNDGTREFLLDEPDCVVFSADTDYQAGQYGTTWQVTAMAQLRAGRWSLIADLDELLVFPGWNQGLSLPDFVAGPALAGADAARVRMLDLYPAGPLAAADPAGEDPFAMAGFTDRVPLIETGPWRGVFSGDRVWTSAVRHRLLPGSRPLLFLAQKYALLRYAPWMRVSEGLHFAAGLRLADRDLAFAHFKYDAAFEARAHDEVERGQHFNGSEEYRAYLALAQGKPLVLYDPAVSVPWHDCPMVQELLAPATR